jgi:AcrR family transcriptional regulator
MARRKKFTIDDIVEAAFQIVRKGGMEKLTARAVARKLKSSTMPIYTCVRSMRGIEEAVVKRAWQVLLEYQLKPNSEDVYIDMGLGYVLFAKSEKHLFKCIHDGNYQKINTTYSEENFEFHLKRLADYSLTRDLSDETKQRLLFYGWLFAQGFASLLNSGIGTYVKTLDSRDAIIAFFKEASAMFWNGLKSTI